MTTVAKLRDTLLRCAREATDAEPNSVEYRLHSFIAKMSGSFEGMGEQELDEALWGLLEAPTKSAQPASTSDLKAMRADIDAAQARLVGAEPEDVFAELNRELREAQSNLLALGTARDEGAPPSSS